MIFFILFLLASTSQAKDVSPCQLALQNAYSASVEKHYRHNEFYRETSSSPLLPENPKPYRLAARLAIGEAHAVESLHLGYYLAKDIHGTSILLAPKDVLVLFRNYRSIIDAAICDQKVTRDETIVPVLVLIKRSLKTLTDHWDDYLFYDPLNDPEPDMTQWQMAADIDPKVQLAPSIWYRIMGQGRMPFPLGSYLDHESAHLTEFSANLELMKHTARYYRMAARLPELWDQNSLRYNSPGLRNLERRMFVVTEYFALPDISKKAEMELIFPGIFQREGTPSERLQAFESELSHNEPSKTLALAKRIVDQHELILLRQGGAARDSYNLKKLDAREFARVGLALARPDPSSQLTNDPFGYGGILTYYAQNETLFVLIDEIEALLRFHANAANELQYQSFGISRPYHKIPSANITFGRFKGDIEEFRAEVLQRVISLIAQIESACYWATIFAIRPEHIVRDSGQIQMDKASITYRYLDAVVTSHSFLREVFL